MAVPETLNTWPKHRAFPGRPNQIAYARDFTRRVLGPCPVLDEAVLLVSELATNAIEQRRIDRPSREFLEWHLDDVFQA